MEIRFYYMSGRNKNRVNKTIPNEYIYMNGELRDAVDVMNPEVIIDISPTSNIQAQSQTPDSLITQFRNAPFNSVNYVYIPFLNRYYFIKNITLLRKNILQFSLHVDVLMFGSFIAYQKAFVSRNQYNFDTLLPDERRIVKNTAEISIIALPNTPPENVTVDIENFDTEFDISNATKNAFNIVALGHTTGVNRTFIENHGGTISQTIGDTTLPRVRTGSFAVANEKCYCLSLEEAGQMLDYIVNSESSLASSVGTIFAYPINFKEVYKDNAGTYTYWNSLEDTFSLGAQSIWTGHDAHVLPHGLMKRFTYRYFTIPDNPSDFNDLEPYSEYELFIPYYGYYKIPYNQVRGHEFVLYYIINFTDGSATVQLYDRTKQELTASLQTQLGMEIPKNTSNITQVRNTHQANNTAIGFSLLSSALAVIAGIATSNPVAVAGGAIGAGKAIGDYAKNEKGNVFTTGINFNGSSSPVYSPQEIYLKKTTRSVQYSLTLNFLKQNGGVLNELHELGDLNGYTEIADIPNIQYNLSVDVVVIPTDNEVNEIITLLKSGVIFP